MITPRQAVLVGLLALVPVAAYGLFAPELTAIVAAVNVVIVTAALYVAFRPIDPSPHGGDGRTA